MTDITWRRIATIAMTASLVGCATASRVMDAGDGTYLISARAAPARGGTAGAHTVAYDDATKFCAERGDGTHAIVVTTNERDVYQGSSGGSFNASGGSFGGGSFAAGTVNLRFRCGK